MGFFDFLNRKKNRGTKGGGIDNPIGLGVEGEPPGEPGEGGPSMFVSDLAAMRWVAQQEAVNLGQMPMEPEMWDGGRMKFDFERSLAHDHEGLRDRLADYVGGHAREVLRSLFGLAGEVAVSYDRLRSADHELAEVLDSWHKSYRDVHEDEIELGRYFRLKSVPYQLGKWAVAIALFLAETAISIALFDEIIKTDNAAMPYLFSLGLILILMVIPHYAAIGIKEGVIRFHRAQIKAYEAAGKTVPSKIQRKARTEEVDDYGIKIIAAVVGLTLVLLFIPLSSLRAKELGSGQDPTFWFWFFFLLQLGISGYFFLREWMDHGTASANLKHHDHSKRLQIELRNKAYEKHASAVSNFMARSEDLLFLYRQAPRWDSYIVESYDAVLHNFRHAVALQHSDLAVFITHATKPYLGTNPDLQIAGEGTELDPVSREHQELLAENNSFSRGWWLKQVDLAAIDSVSNHGADQNEGSQEADGDDSFHEKSSIFQSPERLLADFLERYFNLKYPYIRPESLDHIEESDEVEDPLPPEPEDAVSDGVEDPLPPEPEDAVSDDASSTSSADDQQGWDDNIADLARDIADSTPPDKSGASL